jgi:hypothetical protein
LERQKKEYERERAAARAKTAREKKAAKENAEKEARRKMGLPEPSKFVRASQPTISKFVRNGSNGKRSWQEMKMESVLEDSDGTLFDAAENDADPPPKLVAVDDDSEDEFGDFPSLSQSDLLQKIDSSMLSMQDRGSDPGSPTALAKQPSEQPYRELSQELPERKPTEDEHTFEDSQKLTEMANTQLLSEAAGAAQKSHGTKAFVLPGPRHTIHKSANPTPPRNLDQRAVASTTQSYRKFGMPPSMGRPALQEVSVNMPPPLIPLKGKQAISFAPTPQNPKLPPQNTAKAHQYTTFNIPPSATQAFLESHLDDFFPSPTQEIRELLSDADSLPSNTQIARELSPKLPEEPVNNLPLHRQVAREQLTKDVKEDRFDNLICSQDLILSSQELLEITTPSRALEKPIFEPEITKQKQVPSVKPRFFEEKEDDLLHAALQESKTTSIHPQAPAPQASERRRPFFEEKEEDLLQAAIHESKMVAAKKEGLKVPLKEVDGNPGKERMLKRALSTATTDYGEDDFSGGEWESLGL